MKSIEEPHSASCGFRAECPRCNYETVLFENDVVNAAEVVRGKEGELWSKRYCPECLVEKDGDVVDAARMEVIDVPE